MLKDFRLQYRSLRFLYAPCGCLFRGNVFFIRILEIWYTDLPFLFRQLMLCDGGLHISTPILDVQLSTSYVVGGLLVDSIFYITWIASQIYISSF